MVRGIASAGKQLWAFGLITSVLVGFLSVNAFADTINVDGGEINIAGNGFCSLREAIDNANDDAQTHTDCETGNGADLIILSDIFPQTPTYQIADAPAAYDTNGSNGLPPITSEITIDGNLTTIERDGALTCNLNGTNDAGEFRIFYVTELGKLTLQDLTISNGCADGVSLPGSGGAIFISSGGCCVASSEISAQAICCDYFTGAVDLIEVDFLGNQANGPGGALFLRFSAQAFAEGGSFITNRADDGMGGAIALEGENRLSILDVEFMDNHAKIFGGAVGSDTLTPSIIEIKESKFEENTAEFGDGGAIVATGTLAIEDTVFERNEAGIGSGGAIFALGTLKISRSAFVDNLSVNYGGAIVSLNSFPGFIAGAGVIPLLFLNLDIEGAQIDNSTFAGNESGNGGAIYNIGTMDISHSTIAFNEANELYVGPFGIGFCFDVDTPVLMSDGSTKRIADVRIGDRVMTYDSELGIQVPRAVLDTFNRETSRFLNINGLKVTDEHPFAVGPDEWVKAGDLRVGDLVMSRDGFTRISRIEEIRETIEVHTIAVEENHNFYVSNGTEFYLVHNKAAASSVAGAQAPGNLPLGGGGILTDASSTVSIRNTILSENGEMGNCAAATTGQFNSLGNNIDFNTDVSDTCQFDGIGDSLLDPLLDPDPGQDNGGDTFTLALLDGSPALDAVLLNDCVDTNGDQLDRDQRNEQRPLPAGRGCDIGAFERESAQLIVELAGAGAGNVTSTPPGIDCPGVTCQFNFPLDTEITLNVNPAPGSTFAGSSGDVGCDTLDPTLDQSKKCQVSFAPDLTVLGAPEQVTTVASYQVPFYCGESKEQFTMNGSTFVVIQEFEVEIELILPQKRILLIIPVGGDPATLVETATLTDPSNFLTPGVMSLPMLAEIPTGKTIKLSCNDILSLPTRIDPDTNTIDQYIAGVLGNITKFGGILTIGSSNQALKIFVTKFVKRLEGTLQANGEIDLLRTDIDRERKEIKPISANLRQDVVINSNPIVPFAPMPMASPATINAEVQARSISNSRAIDFRVEGMSTSEFSVEIYGLSGARIFNESSISGPLRWKLTDRHGRPVANGVYLYRVAARGPDGQTFNSEIKKLLVLR